MPRFVRLTKSVFFTNFVNVEDSFGEKFALGK